MTLLRIGLCLLIFCVAVDLIQGDPEHIGNQPAYRENLRNVEASRVVAGWPARDGQIPYQVHLSRFNNVGAVARCGGSVVHHEWILTAAHCLQNRFSFLVKVGMTNQSHPLWLVEASRKFFYPTFDQDSIAVQTDDLGLLQLDDHIPYGPTIQPIRLQSSEQRNLVYTGVVLTVSGFGLTDDLVNGGAVSEILQWTHLRGISNEECLDWYVGSTVIQAKTICAEYYNDTAQSSCSGDSGGPLTMVDTDGLATQVGVVSFGSAAGCNSPFPSAYVRPGHYHSWFREVTGLNFDWTSTSIPGSSSGQRQDTTRHQTLTL